MCVHWALTATTAESHDLASLVTGEERGMEKLEVGEVRQYPRICLLPVAFRLIFNSISIIKINSLSI